MRFVWDPAKARLNKIKHDVTFEEASECFADPLGVMDEDRRHAGRFVLIGESRASRLILTIFAHVVDDVIRIISARKATPRERRTYEEGTE